ncbi:MAG TPA: hypothetical protein VGR43_06600 [Dehalococcoidia bacterium]|nr:hypothetical protein [Dehalococcoidia bacterium]
MSRTSNLQARSLTRWILGGAALLSIVTVFVFLVNGGPLFGDWTFNRFDRHRGTPLEQCYRRYGGYSSGWPPQTDAATKQQLDGCLSEAKAQMATPAE